MDLDSTEKISESLVEQSYLVLCGTNQERLKVKLYYYRYYGDDSSEKAVENGEKKNISCMSALLARKF